MAKVNTTHFSQKQRIIVASIYLLVLIFIFSRITGNLSVFLFSSNLDSRICFLTGALLLILGNYLVEPFFTKPSDAIVNSIAVILALLSINEKEQLIGYSFLLYYSLVVLGLSVLCILTKDINNKFSRIIYIFIEMIGKSKVIFSFVYLLSIYSYFGNKNSIIDFISLMTFWVMIACIDIVEIIINRLFTVFKLINEDSKKYIGVAIGCDNPLLYTVEITNRDIDFEYRDLIVIEKNHGIGYIGVIIHVKHLVEKNWIQVYLLSEKDDLIEINLKEDYKGYINKNSIHFNENRAWKVNYVSLKKELKERIQKNDLFQDIDKFIGYITTDSNINVINFTILRDDYKLSEGTIVKSKIFGQETLYQIINGVTNKEILERHNYHGYLVGTARKLGKYNYNKYELNSSHWLPTMYTPVFATLQDEVDKEELKEIAQSSIGRLPNTNLRIPIKDLNSLVTHNTAILGILGIGKSCLAFELIKKVVDIGVKAICIDITNQYSNSKTGLPTYIEEEKITTEITDESLTKLENSKNNKGSRNNPNEWGNEKIYRNIIETEMNSFIEDKSKKVFILNPDRHVVTKAASKYNIEDVVDLTVSEKTRIISEVVFMISMKLGEADKARFWLIYEEAHSLIPEWNSVANEGDKIATNGTAKVILQGRKYGLGCLVVTQRTANISKSILNQCNTIFALRVFDDTGKNFLENYIGSDYAETLPTLEERHAIAIGKGLRLKQPIIIRLNDKENLTPIKGEN